MKTKNSSGILFYAVLAFAVLASPTARAAARVWVGSTSTDWVTNANWNGGTILTTGDSITFNAAGTQGATLTNTITGSAFNIAGITFSATAPAYTLSGNTFNLTAGITNSSNSLQTFSNTGGLTNSAASTFTVSAAGNTTITNGLTDTGAAGLTTTVNGVGGTLTLGSFTLNSGAAAAVTDTLAGTGNITVSGAVSNGSAFTNGLTVTSTGVVTLSGTNTYTGLTTMNAAGGRLVLAGDNNAATGGLTATAGTVDLRNTKAIAGTLTGGAGALGTIVNGTGGAITLANVTSTVTSAGFTLGALANTGGNGDINFGTGTVSYASAAGTILMLGTGSTFRFDGVATNTAGTSSSFAVNGAGNTLVFGNTVVANGTGAVNALSTFSGTGNITMLGAVTNGTNSSALGYSGFGTLKLGGNNTYTGSTNLNSGTVILDYSTNATTKISGIATGGTLTLAGSVSLNLNAGVVTETVQAWNLNAGANSITRTNSSTGKIIANGLTRGAGGTLALSAGGMLNTTSGTNPNNALFITSTGVVGVVGGNDWAAKAVSGGDVVGLSTLATNYTSSTGTTVTGNSNVIGNVTFAAAAVASATTLRFNTAGATTIDASGGGTPATLSLTQGGILVTSAVGANLTTITGGTLKAGSNNALFVFQNNTTGGLAASGLTIGSAIADGSAASALTKSGAGLLTLTNASNSYTGKTYLNQGTLNIAAETSLGVTPGSVVADQLTMTGGTLQFGAANITLSANRGLTITGGGNTIDTNSFNGSIAGIIANATAAPGSLTKTGAGTLTLSATNSTFTGPFQISGGTVNVAALAGVNAASSIGNGGRINQAQDLVLDGGLLQYTGVSAASTVRQYTLTTSGGGFDASGTSTGSLTFSGAMTASGTTGTQTFTLTGTGSGTSAGTLSGTINNGTGTNVTALAKTGAGTWTLSGANAYTGGTTINAGTLALGSSGAVGSSGNIVFGGGTLQFSASNTTDYSARIKNSGSAVALDTNGQSVSLGVVDSTNAAGLTKSGAGTLTLSAANTYTGVTTISAGTLVLASTGTIASSSGVNLGTSGSQGTLDLTAKSGFSFGVGQTVSGYGTINIGGTGKTVTVNGNIAPGNSTGVIAVNGDLTLAGTTTMELLNASQAAGTGFDQINASGILAYGGVLSIDVTPGTTTLGAYNLFDFASRSGSTTFSAINFLDVGAAGTFDYSTGILTLTAVPEPATWALLAFSLTTVMVLRRRRS